MEGFVNFQGALSLAHRQLIADFAVKNGLPAVYQSAFFTEVGGLMAWAPNQEEQFRIAARYVDQILEGGETRRSSDPPSRALLPDP
jgi:putative ABC transport system substrate-binding protein